MASTHQNLITHAYSGKVGKQIVLKTRGEKSIITIRPKKRKGVDPDSITARQKELRRLFARSIVYAKKSLENPSVMEIYKSVARGNQTAYNVAMKDAMTPPELSNLRTDGYTGAAGQQIIIEAIDNVRVAGVSFQLISSDGTLLESGAAIQDENGFDWVYTTQVENPLLAGTTVLVKAQDLPKNTTELEHIL